MKPYVKSEPIPEVNNEPVKVVVRDSLRDVVINSGKNGMWFSYILFILYVYGLHLAFSSKCSCTLVLLSALDP